MSFQHKEAKRINAQNKPISCSEMLTFAKGLTVNRISLAHSVKVDDGNLHVLDQVIYIRNKDGKKILTYEKYCGNEKTLTENFEILNNNKIVKLKESLQKN